MLGEGTTKLTDDDMGALADPNNWKTIKLLTTATRSFAETHFEDRGFNINAIMKHETVMLNIQTSVNLFSPTSSQEHTTHPASDKTKTATPTPVATPPPPSVADPKHK